ncbi:FG-GAP-like repeat-containing protein [Lunatibacter salilacus]|uniref:FG-GAP-like repeat-containing protein n=1 Tax=Lunatibacter salilacus TaxID=2483804 RepID=UPI00131E87F1|nr:FG-GAP-like repeat-containing protein [Lunatibacter salilacus]
MRRFGNLYVFFKSIPVAALIALFSCSTPEEKLFRLLPASHTNITFSNDITESDSVNILTEEFIFNGGGVAVGDFNNDGLPDLFFSGNEVPNKLYLNRGNLTFEDVSEQAGIKAIGKWSTGVTVVDVNRDGLMDLYVCAAMKKDSLSRANMLFVNQGVNKDCIPVFEEQAEKYGIAEKGYSMSAVFLDFDNDGLLDLYVLNNLLVTSLPGVYRDKITDGTAGNNDRLYNNNGDGTFTDVSDEAGILIEGYGLGVAIADFNEDGWPDIYVSNDYLSNDILYINNQNGTFTNRITDYIRHQSYFSMGVDVGDINNDGLFDLITLDMLAETNYRMKTTISKNSYQTYVNNEAWGYEYQYVRNMLHLNNGMGVPFSEIGHMAGVFQTDWSWSPLLVDMDNDGRRDLMVTNGYPRDITDKDFTNFRADMGATASPTILLDSIPIVKIPNYAFRNMGNLSFENVSAAWGIDHPSFSNGAVFVDLDLDGDLDYVVNNINGEAFVFENQLNPLENDGNNYVRIRLKGTAENPQGLGAKIWMQVDENSYQYHQNHLARGYMSTVEEVVHFGVGTADKVASLEVRWQEGRRQVLRDIPVNQVLELDISAASPDTLKGPSFGLVEAPNVLLDVTEEKGVDYLHQERDRIDFNLQRTLPHKLSQYGPGLAVGDINGDGMEDLLVGGSAGYPQTILFQKPGGTFYSHELGDREESVPEDMGLLLADFDNDGDLDLYAVSGSNEYAPGESVYQDRILWNDGKGNFSLDTTALPFNPNSGTVVRAADMDGDGWLDLFVGGRSEQGQYPMPGENRVLKNKEGKFVDVTLDVAPELHRIGMVTDALWTDYDGDGRVDLLVVGEFMEITFFRNTGDSLIKATDTGLQGMTGWWNGITAGDFDGDGDTDYLIGNWGLNNFYRVTQEHPLTLYAKDFDKNQSVDPVIFSYFKDEKLAFRPYPVHFWEDLYGQSPIFRRKFHNFKSYGRAGKEEIFTSEELDGALVLEANQMASVYLENLGDGTFAWKELPRLAQVAPIYGMISMDVDGDGHLDALLVGNDYGNEVFSGRLDALTGLWLKGDGAGNFEAIGSAKSGFAVFGDAKALVTLSDPANKPTVIASQNRGKLKLFEVQNSEGKFFEPNPSDLSALIRYTDGRIRKVEFYVGSGFLSQSSRKVYLGLEVERVEVLRHGGTVRILSGDSFE